MTGGPVLLCLICSRRLSCRQRSGVDPARGRAAAAWRTRHCPLRDNRHVHWLPALLTGAICAGAAAAESLSTLDPATNQAHSIRELFHFVSALVLAIVVIVEGLIIYCVIRFRRRAADPADEPPQLYGSRPVEVAWTVAPLLVVFVLFLINFRTMADLKQHHPPADSLNVVVVGHQWWWEFRYPDLGVTTANELVIPAKGEGSRPINLHLESVDVIHSFWVPRLNGKTDLIPGRTNHLWFDAPTEGIYWGQCAEYCGTQHGNMLLRVEAKSRGDFDQWIAGQQKSAAVVPAVETGRKKFLSLGCVNCHAVRGTLAKGTFGPDLTHLASRATLGAGVAPMNRDNLIRWIRNPDDLKPGVNMPSMHLSDADIQLVVDYLLTLR